MQWWVQWLLPRLIKVLSPGVSLIVSPRHRRHVWCHQVSRYRKYQPAQSLAAPAPQSQKQTQPREDLLVVQSLRKWLLDKCLTKLHLGKYLLNTYRSRVSWLSYAKLVESCFFCDNLIRSLCSLSARARQIYFRIIRNVWCRAGRTDMTASCVLLWYIACCEPGPVWSVSIIHQMLQMRPGVLPVMMANTTPRTLVEILRQHSQYLSPEYFTFKWPLTQSASDWQGGIDLVCSEKINLDATGIKHTSYGKTN